MTHAERSIETCDRFGNPPEIPACIKRDADNRAPFMVGKYVAHYSPLSVEEIAAEDPELTALFARSTPVSPAPKEKFPWDTK